MAVRRTRYDRLKSLADRDATRDQYGKSCKSHQNLHVLLLIVCWFSCGTVWDMIHHLLRDCKEEWLVAEITNEAEGHAPSRPSGCWDVSRGGAQSAKRAKPPLPPCCGRGISELHCDGVPAFARYKSILRMYLVGTESIGRLMPTNLSACARMSAQWYCATFRGAASSLGRHPALNICQRLFASCMRT